VNNKL